MYMFKLVDIFWRSAGSDQLFGLHVARRLSLSLSLQTRVDYCDDNDISAVNRSNTYKDQQNALQNTSGVDT